jgi:hypothetical protein
MAGVTSDDHMSLMSITRDDVRTFYERLLLWSVIRPNGCQPSMPVRSSWQRCLDSLAFLCDTQTGGKSVSALAIQEYPDRLHYWIACNGPSNRAKVIITWLLGELHLWQPTDGHDPLPKRILLEMVVLCRARVLDYHRRLKLSISGAYSQTSGPSKYRVARFGFTLSLLRRIMFIDTIP